MNNVAITNGMDVNFSTCFQLYNRGVRSEGEYKRQSARQHKKEFVSIPPPSSFLHFIESILEQAIAVAETNCK